LIGPGADRYPGDLSFVLPASPAGHPLRIVDRWPLVPDFDGPATTLGIFLAHYVAFSTFCSNRLPAVRGTF